MKISLNGAEHDVYWFIAAWIDEQGPLTHPKFYPENREKTGMDWVNSAPLDWLDIIMHK